MAAPTDTTCPCRACTKIRLTINQIFRILDIYGWLLNSYVVDFFQENLWEKLPKSWRFTLQDTSPQEFGSWISGDILCSRVWPLSLLALRQTISNLQINRNNEDPKNTLSCANCKKAKSKDNQEEEKNKGTVLNDLTPQYSKINILFSKRIKMKKRYEIEQIAQVCAKYAKESNSKCIVDIGAGMGHLARMLAFQHGLYVACVEQDSTLLQQAKKCDQEFLMSIQRHLPNFHGYSPQHVVAKLESSKVCETRLVDDLQELFKDKFPLPETESKFGLVGLHPCGDLAPMLLKLYCSTNATKFICIVGCCYMRSEAHGLQGYPLSKYLNSFKHHELSYTALEVACHAIEKYCDKLKTGNYEDLIVHAYRAALETILIKKNEQLYHSQVKNVKVTRGMTFEQYCSAATSHLETHLQPSIFETSASEIKHFLHSWQQVIIFSSLRMMLAPLVETVVLFDRFLFLSEQNLAPTLRPVFDGRLSPRNIVLTSMKDS